MLPGRFRPGRRVGSDRVGSDIWRPDENPSFEATGQHKSWMKIAFMQQLTNGELKNYGFLSFQIMYLLVGIVVDF